MWLVWRDSPVSRCQRWWAGSRPGRLSVDQVAVVARQAPSQVEASVAELAVSASVPQLGRVLSRYAFDPPTGEDPASEEAAAAVARTGVESGTDAGAVAAADAVVAAAAGVEPVLDEVGRAGAPAELSMCSREGGRFVLRFSAPADVGALVQAAVAEARDALFAAGTVEVTWADALVEVCARSLARCGRSVGGTRFGSMCIWTPRVAG
jgi:hypothetical protein